MDVSTRIRQLLPALTPTRRPDGCLIAHLAARSEEHHPPLHALGRGLDACERAGLLDAIGERLALTHEATCDGWGEADQSAQDVLSLACALAWADARLGDSGLVEAADTPESSAGITPLIAVRDRDVYVAARRLQPVRTMEQLLAQVGECTEAAACALPRSAASRILYLDIPLNVSQWMNDIGYDLTTTEPLQSAVRHCAAERGIGHILTRPFQWAAPIEQWY